MITIISQTTNERKEETANLFNAIKPLLDDGYSYHSAVKMVKNDKRKDIRYYRQRWFAELKEYGERCGYPYEEYSGKGRK